VCVLGQPEPVGSVLTFPSGYDTLEYSWVKATAVSVRLRILFVMLQNTNTSLLSWLDCLLVSVIFLKDDEYVSVLSYLV